MAYVLPPEFEDQLTEKVVATFADLPNDERQEPVNMTNDRLPELASELGLMARRAGCKTHRSVPRLTDKWQTYEGAPSTYTIVATWDDLKDKPSFIIPVLPRDAA